MAINQFQHFANNSSANLQSIDDYLAATTTTSGYQTGEALSADCNRTWEQATMGSYILGQIIVDVLGVDASDDQINPVNDYALEANLCTAIRSLGYAADTSTVVNTMNAVIVGAAPISLQNGMVITIVPNITNTTSVTLNLNSLGAYPVVSNAGVLRGGELVAGNAFQLIFLSSLGTSGSWLLLNYQTTCITQAVGDNSTQLASTAYVMNSGFAPNLSPSLTGTPNSTTPPTNDNSTRIATTAWVRLQGFAPLASPNFTGIPTCPTAAFGTATAQIASTAFVQQALQAVIPTGTRSLFVQNAAPTGWTLDTSDIATNRLLRVVPGGGNTGGGIHDSWYCNVVPYHTHNVTTGGESATHTHNDYGHTHAYTIWSSWQPQSGSATPCWYHTSTSTTGAGYASLTNETVGHIHYGSTDGGSSNTTWQPRYANTIICSKN